MTDTHGNNSYYTYTEIDGASYLNKIEYNTEKARVIDFAYVINPTTHKFYSQGCKITESSRLSNIQVKANTNLVSRFDFAYATAGNGRQLLSSITEKGSDGSSLPPTTFDYKPEIKTWQLQHTSWEINNAFDVDFTMPATRLLDVNNDGLPDVIKVNSSGGNNTYLVYKNTGATWNDTPETWVNNVNMDARPDQYWTRLVDVNGDSLPDIVKATSDTWYVWKNTGKNWNPVAEKWAVNSQIPGFTETNNNMEVVDVDGDGLADIVRSMAISGPITRILVYKNTGTGWNATPETWANDIIDVPVVSSPQASFTDVNGDGLVDIVKSKNNGGPNNEWQVWLNTGSSWDPEMLVWANPIAANLEGAACTLTDVNGDGLPDIVRSILNGGPNNDWTVWLNNGNGWGTQSQSWVNPIDSNIDNTNESRIADVNGDGLIDILRVVHNGGPNNDWRVWLNNGHAPDLLSAVHTPQGGTKSFAYTNSVTPITENTSTTTASYTGEYFANQNLSGSPTLTRTDSSINFDWGSGSPDGSIPTDHFSARWTQTASFTGGTYVFTATSDDGVRIYVDNELILDHF